MRERGREVRETWMDEGGGEGSGEGMARERGGIKRVRVAEKGDMVGGREPIWCPDKSTGDLFAGEALRRGGQIFLTSVAPLCRAGRVWQPGASADWKCTVRGRC